MFHKSSSKTSRLPPIIQSVSWTYKGRHLGDSTMQGWFIEPCDPHTTEAHYWRPCKTKDKLCTSIYWRPHAQSTCPFLPTLHFSITLHFYTHLALAPEGPRTQDQQAGCSQHRDSHNSAANIIALESRSWLYLIVPSSFVPTGIRLEPSHCIQKWACMCFVLQHLLMHQDIQSFGSHEVPARRKSVDLASGHGNFIRGRPSPAKNCMASRNISVTLLDTCFHKVTKVIWS